MFRVTIRGAFEELGEDDREALRTALDSAQVAFTEAATFTCDRGLRRSPPQASRSAGHPLSAKAGTQPGAGARPRAKTRRPAGGFRMSGIPRERGRTHAGPAPG